MMKKQSTNAWALERARKSVGALENESGANPLLIDVLSRLLWVVDHQQDELERVYDWTKYVIEQSLVDHARSDGTVQTNETCRQAVKDWYRTETVGRETERIVSKWRNGPLRAMPPNILLETAERLKAEVEQLQGELSEARALLDAERIQR